jgi:hypothetical protein
MGNDDWLNNFLNPNPLRQITDNSSSPFGGFENLLQPLPPPRPSAKANPFPLASLGLLPQRPQPVYTPPVPTRVHPVLRKVYFAFSFEDIMRVNNVRQIGKIGPRVAQNPRMFRDRSIWERRDIKTVENLKNLMRNAMRYSSVVCVTIGSRTWNSRWAKYEIARSVVDEKGLFAVHINSIDHHYTKAPDALGVNPLHVMGIWRNEYGTAYLVEQQPVVVDPATAQLGWQWVRYEDYKDPIQRLPRYIPHLGINEIVPLSRYTSEYDMIAHAGFKNFGDWTDAAAAQVGIK